MRFKGKVAKPYDLPEAVWVNRPSTDEIRVESMTMGVSFSLTYSEQHGKNEFCCPP
jgi:hypothetical protein